MRPIVYAALSIDVALQIILRLFVCLQPSKDFEGL